MTNARPESRNPEVPDTSLLHLYFSPGACSRVSIIALEEAGAEYVLHRVLLAKGEQKEDSFRRLNPKGKVPVLTVGDLVLTESVAILHFIANRFPDAGLLPRGSAWEEAQALSGLAWFASTLHPLVTRLRLAQRFCDLPGAEERVRELARQEMASQLKVAEQRLVADTWILGSEWSVLDAYLFWVWARCPESGIDPEGFPALVRHAERVRQRSSVQRAFSRELELSG